MSVSGTVIRSTSTHRMVQDVDVLSSLAPAEGWLRKSTWRVERKAACQDCDSFVCECRCECGVEYVDQQCPECMRVTGQEHWDLRAEVWVSQAYRRYPGPIDLPVRVELDWGGLPSSADLQAIVWVGALLQEVAAESAAVNDLPVVLGSG